MTTTTTLTKLLNIRLPIVSAPMAFAVSGLLAAKVSAAGGFGFLSPAYGTGLEKFKNEISIARSTLKISSSTATIPIGIGFLGWKLETDDPEELELLDVALESRPQAIWLSFGNDLGRWVQHVRESDTRSNRKTIIFTQVNSVKEAVSAVNDWKVDILVAQGIEAGGHGSGSAPPTATLVSSILSGLGDKCPPLLAAGGLANGTDVASMIKLGAAGAVLGTRFLLSHESLYSDAQKQALLAATDTSTIRSMAFDYARNTIGWPEGVDGRGIRNELVTAFDNGGVDAVKKEFENGVKERDIQRTIIWAGTGVGSMNKITSVEEIVEELSTEIARALSQ